jgi:hypothetical protein
MTKSISFWVSSGNIGNEMQEAAFRSEFGIGPGVFAISGATAGVKHRLDLFGGSHFIFRGGNSGASPPM